MDRNTLKTLRMSTSEVYTHGTLSISNHQHDTDGGRGISIAKPDLFYGDHDKVDDWLMQLQVYFTFQESNWCYDQGGSSWILILAVPP